MRQSDLEVGALFTKDGTDIWELIAYNESPTCVLRNLRTDDTEQFGIGGLTSQKFKRVRMEVQDERTG